MQIFLLSYENSKCDLDLIKVISRGGDGAELNSRPISTNMSNISEIPRRVLMI